MGYEPSTTTYPVYGFASWLTVSTGAIKEESYDNMIGVAIRFYERFLALDTARMREIQMD
jgi:hypothetical protein